tara:strand:+ start:1085 stop:3052 length:1968 start_codon:yes stop_codon:yes gene_type:complete
MTIEYKDSKRIVGLSTDTVETLSFEDNSFSSGWTQTGTAIVATGGQAVFTAVPRNAEHRICKSLGLTVDNAKFILDFKINISAMSSQYGGIWIGLSSDSTWANIGGSNDFLGFNFHDNAGGSTLKARTVHYNAGSLLAGSNSTTTFTSNGTTDYYVRLIRTSATTAECYIYSDSARTILVEKIPSFTTLSTVNNLTHIQVTSQNASVSATFTGIVDEIKLWSGVSSLTSKPTNVQDNSIFVEKDTAKRYWASIDPTNTGFTGWTADSSGDAVTSNNIVTVTPNSNNSALQGVNYDIGTANIGSTWTLQFIIDTTAWSNNSACDFRDAGIWVHDGVSNGDNVSCGISNTTCSGAANGKGFALKVCNGAGYKGYIDADISGTREIIPTRNASGTGYTYPSTTQGAGSDGRLGVRLMRLSSTAFRLEFWNNTDFSGSASVTYNTTATTLCGNITGLRYIMIGGYKQGSAGGSNTQAISELKFYNESITNPPVGTATWTRDKYTAWYEQAIRDNSVALNGVSGRPYIFGHQNNTGSSKDTKSVTFLLTKYGTGGNGTLTARIYNSSGALQHTSTNSILVSSITGLSGSTFESVTFNFTGATTENTWIVCLHTTGDTSGDNFVAAGVDIVTGVTHRVMTGSTSFTTYTDRLITITIKGDN